MKQFIVWGWLFFVFLSTAGFPYSVTAGTVTGTFEFVKRPARGAIVYMSEDKSLRAAALIDQKNKHFSQIIVIGIPGSRIEFKNSDTIGHNIFAADREKNVHFDIGLAPPGTVSKSTISWKIDSFVKISCKIHPRMRAYIGAVKSKYYAVVEFSRKQKKTTFTISGVPDNLKKVRVWLPGYKPVEIEIQKNQTKKIDLIRRKKSRGIVTISRN